MGLCAVPQPRLVCTEYFASKVVVEATLIKVTPIKDKKEPGFFEAFVYSLRADRVLRGQIDGVFQVYEENDSGRASFGALQEELKYYGNKGARDTLIDLRLAKDVMALDARIFGLLRKVGVKVSPDDIYRQIEEELIEKVARPLGLTGAVLDRVLFRNYDRILKQR